MNKVFTSTPVLYGVGAIAVIVVGYLVYRQVKVGAGEAVDNVTTWVSKKANEIKQAVTGEDIVNDNAYPELRGSVADAARRGSPNLQVDEFNDAVNQDSAESKRAAVYEINPQDIGTLGA